MQPFDEESGREAERAGPKRRSGFTILVIVAVLVLVVIAVVLHLAGGAPTHGR